MKIIDETETQTKKQNKTKTNKQTNKKTNKQRQKRASGTEAIVKWCGLNNFVVHLS